MDLSDFKGAVIKNVVQTGNQLTIWTDKGNIIAGEGDAGSMRSPEPYFYVRLNEELQTPVEGRLDAWRTAVTMRFTPLMVYGQTVVFLLRVTLIKWLTKQVLSGTDTTRLLASTLV